MSDTEGDPVLVEYNAGLECVGDPRTYWKLDYGRGKWGTETYKKCLRDNKIDFDVDEMDEHNMKLELYETLRSEREISDTSSYKWRGGDNLIDLVQERGLSSSVPRLAKRAQLIAALKAADEARTFNRFTELPPELRVRIYNMHIMDLRGSIGFTAAQPPITRVSKMLREETLPVFYRNVQFGLKLEWRKSYDLYPTPDSKLVFDDATSAFWMNLGDNYLSGIRDLYLLTSIAGSPTEALMVYKIELAIDGKRESCVELVDFGGCRQDMTRTGSKLRALVKEISARAGPHKLRRGDIDRLRRACDFRIPEGLTDPEDAVGRKYDFRGRGKWYRVISDESEA